MEELVTGQSQTEGNRGDRDRAENHELRYGDRLTFHGNIDVRRLAGSREDVAEEIDGKMSHFTEGGWIYHSDHSIPPEVRFDNYRYALSRVRGESAAKGQHG